MAQQNPITFIEVLNVRKFSSVFKFYDDLFSW